MNMECIVRDDAWGIDMVKVLHKKFLKFRRDFLNFRKLKAIKSFLGNTPLTGSQQIN